MIATNTGGGTALQVNGKAKFNRSGTAMVAAGVSSVNVSVPGMTASSMVIATAQQNVNVFVARGWHALHGSSKPLSSVPAGPGKPEPSARDADECQSPPGPSGFERFQRVDFRMVARKRLVYAVGDQAGDNLSPRLPHG